MSKSSYVLGGNVFNVQSGGTVHLNPPPDASPSLPGSPFDKLVEKVAPGALYNSSELPNPPHCHPGTRDSVLKWLSSKATSTSTSQPIVWLHGPAGAGKTAIMRTLAERLDESSHLFASFFFSRSARFRNTPARFIPTLAYQVCRRLPDLRPRVEESVRLDPLIFKQSLITQMEQLVIGPAKRLEGARSSKPTAILVDALDECGQSAAEQKLVMDALLHLAKNYPTPLCIIIASRTEHDLIRLFKTSPFSDKTCIRELTNDAETSIDIEKYLLHHFDAIVKTHVIGQLPLDANGRWPPLQIVHRLVRKASGQFIFVATVIRFVQHARSNPRTRLQIIIGALPPGRLQPFQELDALYIAILSEQVEDESFEDVLQLFRVATYPLQIFPFEGRDGELRVGFIPQGPGYIRELEAFECILGLEPGQCQLLLVGLESLVGVTPESEIVFHHQSFFDFLADPSRSGKFYISASSSAELMIDTMLRLGHGLWPKTGYQVFCVDL